MIRRPPKLVPAWAPDVDRALAAVAEEVKLIRAVTPENADAEARRVERAWLRGVEAAPAWRYDAHPVRIELRRAIDELACFVEKDALLGAVYAARARELALEAEIIHAIGTPRVQKLASLRFVGTSQDDLDDRARADALARAWTATLPEPTVEPLVPTDDPGDPRSLVSLLSREVGRLRLPLRVIVQPGLASLAATAEGAILVAPARWVRPADVARTVMHEIAGHALPRARAASAPLGIFSIGTARGVDDQEGRALALERRAGFLDVTRLRELGLRHTAAAATLDGASFVEVVRGQLALGATIGEAVRVASRVQRGGGLAREIVYLPALVRFERAMWADPTVEGMMARGRIAVREAATIAMALGSPREVGDVA